MPPRNARAHGAWAIVVRDKRGGWRAAKQLGSGSGGSSAHLAAAAATAGGARARRGRRNDRWKGQSAAGLGSRLLTGELLLVAERLAGIATTRSS